MNAYGGGGPACFCIDGQPFAYGTSQTLPTDRAPIRAASLYTNSEGEAVHEEVNVHTVAFLLHGKYSDTRIGEGVNCYVHGVANNDIHLTLVNWTCCAAHRVIWE